MKTALIIYACIAIVWFIIVVYSSYKDKYRLERNYNEIIGINAKVTVDWAKIILGTIFWPIDMLIYLIKTIAMKNSR